MPCSSSHADCVDCTACQSFELTLGRSIPTPLLYIRTFGCFQVRWYHLHLHSSIATEDTLAAHGHRAVCSDCSIDKSRSPWQIFAHRSLVPYDRLVLIGHPRKGRTVRIIAGRTPGHDALFQENFPPPQPTCTRTSPAAPISSGRKTSGRRITLDCYE